MKIQIELTSAEEERIVIYCKEIRMKSNASSKRWNTETKHFLVFWKIKVWY